MRKSIKMKTLLTMALCGVAFVGAGVGLSVNAKAEGEAATIAMTEGASIRYGENSGIRFQATVAGTLEEGASVGCLIAKASDLATPETLLVAGAEGVKDAENAKPAEENGATYNYAFYNLPLTEYHTDFVARAYIKSADGAYTYAAEQQTRSIYDVADTLLTGDNCPTDADEVATLKDYVAVCSNGEAHDWAKGAADKENSQRTDTCNVCGRVETLHVFYGEETFDSQASASLFTVGNTDQTYLETYEGATGVIKTKVADNWFGVQLRLQNIDVAEDWNKFEIKLAADFDDGVEGGRETWDGLYSNAANWVVTTEGVWRTYTATKNGIVAAFGSVEEFYKAITVGGREGNDQNRLFVPWNFIQHGNIYVDHVKMYKLQLNTESNAAGITSSSDSTVIGTTDVFVEDRYARKIDVTGSEEIYVKELTAADRTNYAYVEFDLWVDSSATITWRGFCVKGEENHTSCGGSHTVMGGVGTDVAAVWNTIALWLNGSTSDTSRLVAG